MQIKLLSTVWPPFTTLKRDKGFLRTELDDVVVEAQPGRDAVSDFIGMTVRTVDGAEHIALLRLPENLLHKALTSIDEKIGSSLRVIGEIDVS